MAKTNQNDWKDRLNVVYSTNKDFEYQTNDDDDTQTLEPSKQNLKISIDRKKRKGKSVTLITGFIGSNDDLKDLSKILKTKCGVGGSSKNNEIIIQGEFKQKILEILKDMGYNVKSVGG